ncbi:hypothetical protein NL676_023539 [Syzygium grande]|nr:hypothetical protein NL676_023539 [Syzygium grande]
MNNKTQKKAALKSRSCDPWRAAADYSECTLESMMVLFDLGYTALSLGGPREQDPRSTADIYSEYALESMIVLFGLGNEALSLGCPFCQTSPNRVEDPRACASHAVRQSEGKQRAKLRVLSKQNSELSTILRAARKCGVELWRELEKCPIKEAPVDQLSLEELKLHKRRNNVAP